MEKDGKANLRYSSLHSRSSSTKARTGIRNAVAHRQAIEVAGGRAHQRECHQYRSNNGCNYHTGAIRLSHLRTLLSAAIPRRVRCGSPSGE